MVRGRPEPDPRLVQQIAELALSLPATYEEDAWTGVRWRVRKRTFAHVAAMRHVDAAEKLGITDGRTVTLMIVRSTGAERAALTAIGPPYLPSWGDDVLAVVLDEISDWTEIAELITESYRLLAPARLVRELDASQHHVAATSGTWSSTLASLAQQPPEVGRREARTATTGGRAASEASGQTRPKAVRRGANRDHRPGQKNRESPSTAGESRQFLSVVAA